MSSWGVIIVRAGREAATAETLTSMAIETYFPTQKLTWKHHGRSHDRIMPLFPNYVIAKFDTSDAHLWHEIRSLPWVIGIVGGTAPSWMSDSELYQVQVNVTEWLANQPASSLGRFKEGEVIQVGGSITGRYQSGDGVTSLIKIALLGQEFVVSVPEALCDPAVVSVGGRSGRRHNRRRQQRSRNRVSPVRVTVPEAM